VLRRFLYLDEQALADYLSAVEGGARDSAQRTRRTAGKGGGGVDLKAVSGTAERSREDQETFSMSDTPAARYERLDQLAKADPEASGWVEVLDIDTDLDVLGIGMIVEVECEIHVPDIVKAMSSSGGIGDALDQLDTLLPFVEALGLDIGTEIPSKTQREAMTGFVRAFNGDQVVVGEFDTSEWRVVGRLNSSYLHGDIEGVARVVGKISIRWPQSEWKPLLALPGMSLLPREQRRRLQQTRPGPAERNQYVEGPAVMLDVLAIYR
jgi:hypothetical protein